MDPTTIIALVELAAKLIQTGVQAYDNISATISENDLTKIKAALAAAEAAGAALRPQVDAALDAAATR